MQTIKLKKEPDGSVSAIDFAYLRNWPSWITSKPDYRNKYVHLNCARYKIEWIKG